LAMMDHPNIARVLDAGTTPSGRPYFVMELVRGIPITRFCDSNKVVMVDRLKIFMDVCSAVQHAHQKGIIHRDLKPSNILVTMNDDRPMPKVIDFGIAKATATKLTDLTLFTQFHQIVGTPAYMSPEQAQLSNKDVDTRSDIYSLGVLLYELLTGKTPFDTQDLMKKGQDAVFRTIQEEDPPRPSMRLSTMTQAQMTAASEARGADPAKLRAQLHGDLDWVVMKTLEKDRTRRYVSANALQKDVQRFLANEPVSAVSPSPLYRFRKSARRHRLAFFTGAAIAVSILAGLIVALTFFLRERKQKRFAEANELVAQQARYASDMRVASTAIRDGDVVLAKTLLDAHIPDEKGRDFRGWAWHFYRSRINQEEHTLHKVDEGHFDEIAFSPNGDLLAASGGHRDKKAVMLFSTRNWSLQRVLPTERGWVCGLHFSNLPAISLTVEQQGRINRYEINGKGSESLFEISEKAWPAKLTSDGKWVVCLMHDNRQSATSGRLGPTQRNQNVLRVFDSGTGEIFKTSEPIQVPEGSRLDNEVRISPDNRMISVSCVGYELRFFSLPDLRSLPSIRTPGEVCTVAWSPDSRHIATGYEYPNQVDVWEVARQQRSHQLISPSQTSPCYDTCFSADGRLLAYSEENNMVHIWDLEKNHEQRVFPAHEAKAAFSSLSFSYDGRWLASAGLGTLKLWRTEEVLSDLRRISEEQSIWNITYSPNGRFLASTAADGVIRLFDSESENLVLEFKSVLHANERKEPPIAKLLFSPDGDRLIFQRDVNQLAIYDLVTNKLTASVETKSWITDFSLDSNGQTIAIATNEYALTLWNYETETKTRIPGLQTKPRYVSFDPAEGSQILACIGEGKLSVIDLETEMERTISSAIHRDYSLRFLRENGHIACGREGGVDVFDVHTMERVQSIEGARGVISTISEAGPDGHTVAIACRGGHVQIWNRLVDAEVGRLPLPPDWMISAEFSPDGKTLAVSTRNNGVQLFRAAPTKP
ncbi:MAG: WD40 repeat domain-containing serine/threonine protein kinase, partial [Verrucomicrobiota bacterium]